MNSALMITSVEARADILRIHSRSMNLTRGIDLKKIAEKMNGCSGAELKGVCTEAGMYALRERRIHVTQEDFGMTLHSLFLPQLGSHKHRSCHRQGTQQARRQGDEFVQAMEVDSGIHNVLGLGNNIMEEFCKLCERFLPVPLREMRLCSKCCALVTKIISRRV